MDRLHQQCMYDDERARRGSFYDYPPLMSVRTFFRLIVGFGEVLVLVVGAHVVEDSHARPQTNTRAEPSGPRRSAPAHVTGRVSSRRAER